MLKTKIKKAFAVAWITAITMTNFANVFAATNIGTAGVQGQGAFDSNVVWDDNFPGTATGTVTGVQVTASVLPTLNMTLSDSVIALGNITPGTAKNGTLDIEVGTNAANGVTITARSANGGLVKTDDPTIFINSTNGDNYTYASTANAIDSTIGTFTSTGDLTATEVTDNTTEHKIYETNKPELDDNAAADVTFTVEVDVDAETPAGDYTDEITFTVTGNF